MDKQFLVLHIYTHTKPCIYLVEGKNLSDFTDECDGRVVKVYEWDIDKFVNALEEVNVEITLNVKKINVN